MHQVLPESDGGAGAGAPTAHERSVPLHVTGRDLIKQIGNLDNRRQGHDGAGEGVGQEQAGGGAHQEEPSVRGSEAVVVRPAGEGDGVGAVLGGGVEGAAGAGEEEEGDLTWQVVGPAVSGGAPGGAHGAEPDVIGVAGYAGRDGEYQIRREVLPITHTVYI